MYKGDIMWNLIKGTTLLGLAASLLLGCGDDGSTATPTCTTKTTTFRICDGSRLYECPTGSGEQTDMQFIRDCAQENLTCNPGGIANASCKDPSGNDSILGENPAQYSKQNKTSESEHPAAEPTGYVLDSKGIAISGTFDSNAENPMDLFLFNTGTYERVDVQAFLNGAIQKGTDTKVTLTLDADKDDGKSKLQGKGYFINAWIDVGQDFILTIHGTGTAGAAYKIEMIGKEVTD